jgi:hypothetical protein
MKSETGSRVKSNEISLACGGIASENEKEALKKSILLTNDNGSGPQSRHELVKEIEELGVNAEELNVLSMEGLRELLDGLHSLVESYNEKKRPGRPKSDPKSVGILSNSDKKIVCQMIESGGHVSSLSLSRELDIPISTIQRRRSRLDEILVETNYSLNVEKLGWKRAMLLISVSSGNASGIGKEILESGDMIESVYRMNGDSIVDLMAEVVFKTNSELVSLMDQIKSKPGVRNVLWSEYVQLVGKNNNTAKRVIESS